MGLWGRATGLCLFQAWGQSLADYGCECAGSGSGSFYTWRDLGRGTALLRASVSFCNTGLVLGPRGVTVRSPERAFLTGRPRAVEGGALQPRFTAPRAPAGLGWQPEGGPRPPSPTFPWTLRLRPTSHRVATGMVLCIGGPPTTAPQDPKASVVLGDSSHPPPGHSWAVDCSRDGQADGDFSIPQTWNPACPSLPQACGGLNSTPWGTRGWGHAWSQ